MNHTKITQKDVLFFTSSFLVVVIAWIASNVYHSFVTSTIEQDLQMQIIPIASTFDTATIQALQTREQITPLFEMTTDKEASPEASITPTTTPPEKPDAEEPTPTISLEPTEEPIIAP